MQRMISLMNIAGTADALLTGKVDRALRATGRLALREVRILACEGFVILHGTVPSYYTKQIAQAAALGVPGVNELQNELEVVACGRTR